MRLASLLLTAFLLTTCESPDCATWNTEAFFKLATPGDTRTCLQAGADVSARDSTDLTPLHLAAAWNENPEVALTLIRAGADLNARSARGETPLHWAADADNTDVLNALIEAGADVSVRDYTGHTPLEAAELNGSSEAAAILRRAGG